MRMFLVQDEHYCALDLFLRFVLIRTKHKHLGYGHMEKADLKSLKHQINAIEIGQELQLESHGTTSQKLNPLDLLTRGFHECLGEGLGDLSSTLGFALSTVALCQKQSSRPVLWAHFAGDTQEHGVLYGLRVSAHGLRAQDLLCVNVKKEQELYWVAEESLKSDSLAAILIAMGNRERRYNFTISRRLKLQCEKRKTPLFFLRHWSQCGATAATARWRVSRLPSVTEPLSVPGQPLIGAARLRLTLERSQAHPPQSWEFGYDTSGGFCLAHPLADRPPQKTGVVQCAA